MAQIIQREWKSGGPTGKRVRHVAFGYPPLSMGSVRGSCLLTGCVKQIR